MAENSPSSYPLPPMQVAPPVSAWWLTLSRQTPAFLLPIGTAFLFLVGWQAIAVYGGISPAVLPPPTMILEQLRDNFPLIMSHSYPTTIETLVAFLISIPLGIALAALLVYSTLAQQALYPNIIFFQLIPKIALAPLFIVWLGVGSKSCIVVAIFIAFFPVVVSTATGLVSAKPEVLLLCRSLTASEWQMFRMARFPYAMPFVFAGMKVGVTMAMIGVIVGEFITAQAGLGYIIMFASSAGETATVLAAIVLLCGIGLALYGIVALGELAVQRWYGGEMPIGGVV